MRAVVISSLLVLLLLAGGIAGFSALARLREAPERIGREPRATVVRALPVVFGTYRESLGGYGRARALHRSEVPAEVSGLVAFVSPELEAGREVGTEEVLVRIAAPDFDSELRSREARLELDRSALRAARATSEGVVERLASMEQEREVASRDFEATRKLFEQDLSSQRELDVQRQTLERMIQRVSELRTQSISAEEAILQAQRQVEMSEEAVARARRDVARCEIRAPYPARVVARRVQPATWINAGSTLFEILDPSRVEVPVSLAASRFGEVDVGSPVRLFDHRGGALLAETTVARCDPRIDETLRSFSVYVELRGEAAASVVPGRFVYATLDGLRHPEVFAVPRVAFVGDEVFVAEESDGRRLARRRRPEVVRWLPDVALVADGLAVGEQVLVTNLEEVADGTPVQVAPESGEPAGEPTGDALGEATADVDP